MFEAMFETMFETMKWKIIERLIKWNVLAIVPVKAQRSGHDELRRYGR